MSFGRVAVETQSSLPTFTPQVGLCQHGHLPASRLTPAEKATRHNEDHRHRHRHCHCHYHRPLAVTTRRHCSCLLVSPYIHGVVLYFPSLWRWRPSSSPILHGDCGLSLASTTTDTINHHHREHEQEHEHEHEQEQQQRQPSASTGPCPPYTTVRDLALWPTGKGWRRLWLVTTKVGRPWYVRFGDSFRRESTVQHALCAYKHSTGSPASLISHLSHIRSPPWPP